MSAVCGGLIHLFCKRKRGFIHNSYLMMTACVHCIWMCASVCLFACTAGLLYILLTGIKVFWSRGAKIRKEEWSGVNGRVERTAVRWFTTVPFHILPHLGFFFYSCQDCLGYFIQLGAGKNVTTYLLAYISPSWGLAAWLLSLIDGPTHQQVGHFANQSLP